MYVCVCNGITESAVREAAHNGCASVAELTMRTGCGASCGTCLDMAAAVLAEARTVRHLDLPVLGLAQAA